MVVVAFHFLPVVFCDAYPYHTLLLWGGNQVPALRQLILWGVSVEVGRWVKLFFFF